MFIKFNNVLYNLSTIKCVKPIVVKDSNDIPTYGIAIDGMMCDNVAQEMFDSVNKRNNRFRQIQNALGAEDCYIGGNNKGE